MLLSGPFEKFVEASPVTVMMRGIIENLFHPERLDALTRVYSRAQTTLLRMSVGTTQWRFARSCRHCQVR